MPFHADSMSQYNRVFRCSAASLQTEFTLYVLDELLSADLAQACATLLLH